MEVKFTPNGEQGKQCRDCKFFEAENANAGIGKCFGNDVPSGGSCNNFVPK